jgi:periplasmic divalent cation tolerance protein
MNIVLCNLPAGKGRNVAQTLIEERRVACVNLLPVQSIFRWKGQVEVDAEECLMMKVGRAGIEALKARILELHPYELPEFVVLDVDTERSFEAYVGWVRDESSG